MITIIKGSNPQLRIKLEGVSYEDLLFVADAEPKALVLTDEEGNETFRLGFGQASVSKYGVVIPYQDEDEEEIVFTVPLNRVHERLQAFLAVQTKENLEKVIAQVNEFIEKLEAAKGDVQYV